MRRVLVAVLSVVALAVACGNSASATAAQVNGSKITTHDLVDELNAIRSNKDYIDSLENQTTGRGLTVNGSTPDSFDAAFVAQVLLRQLDYRLIHDEATKRKLAIDDACRQQARDNAIQSLGPANAGSGTKTGQELFDQFPATYQDLLVRRFSEFMALEDTLSGQSCGKSVDAEGYYNTHPEDFTAQCVSVIAVADQDTANTVVAQARAGADFGTLVQKYSTDTSTKANGGSIGCRLPSEFNSTVGALLQAAKVGDVLDPIPGQSGYSVATVTDRQLVPLDQVRQQAEELATTASGQAFRTWLQQAHAAAAPTVQLDPRYGTFDASAFTIKPPTFDVSSSSSSDGASSTSTGSP